MGLERFVGEEAVVVALFLLVMLLAQFLKRRRASVVVFLLLPMLGCTLFPGGPAGLPPIKPPITDPSPPAPTPVPEPQPTPDPVPTPAKPTPTCQPVPAEGEVHETGAFLFGGDIRRAIEAAYVKAGGIDDLISGPQRPGKWDRFVYLVAEEGAALGYCVSYDYEHGEEGGRASEMGFRKGNRVEYVQIETSAGRVRTPPGALRSWAEPACCEGQAVRKVEP
jgi:hypothetical protein